MPAPTLTRRLFWAAELAAARRHRRRGRGCSPASEWHPIALVALLLALALVRRVVQRRDRAAAAERLAGRDGAGDGPARARAGRGMRRRRDGPHSAVAAAAAGAMAEQPGRVRGRPLRGRAGGARAGRATSHGMHGQHASHRASLRAGRASRVCRAAIVVNFVLFALELRVEEGRSLARQMRECSCRCFPGELAAGVLAAILALAYRSLGLPVLFGGDPRSC